MGPTTTSTSTATPSQPRDDERVTVILPGGAVVICRPDQVAEVTRPAWTPIEITCSLAGLKVDDPEALKHQIAAVARGAARC